MDKITDQVRSSVLDKVSSPSTKQVYDAADIHALIVSSDEFIRLFCRQYTESHDGKHDITAITSNVIDTLKWRKSVNIRNIKADDFPLEIWTRNPAFAYEDDQHVLILYTMRDESRICQSWTDLTFKFMLRNYEQSLHTAMKGKKNIMLCDTSGLSLSKLDVSMQSQLMKLLDKHFPCIFDCMCIYGLPRFLTSMANLFTKLALPHGLKKKFFVIDRQSVQVHVPEQLLPIEFGGSIKVKEVLEFYHLDPKSIQNDPQKWGMGELEAAKVLASCSRD